LEGKDVSDFKDANGVPLFTDAVAVIKRDGQGFPAYSFPKLGKPKPLRKSSTTCPISRGTGFS